MLQAGASYCLWCCGSAIGSTLIGYNSTTYMAEPHTHMLGPGILRLCDGMQDTKVVEYACLALSRIAEALARSPEHLEMLCNQGLVSSAVQLVTVTENGSMTSQLSISTYYGLIRLLTSCASGSHAVAESLLQADLSTTMRNLLARYMSLPFLPPRCPFWLYRMLRALPYRVSRMSGLQSAWVHICLLMIGEDHSRVLWIACKGVCMRSSPLLSTSATSSASVLCSSDQLRDVVTLALELLPPLPEPSQIVEENRRIISNAGIHLCLHMHVRSRSPAVRSSWKADRCSIGAVASHCVR